MWMSLLRWIGQRTVAFFREMGTVFILLYRILIAMPSIFRDHHLVLKQMLEAGVNSLPLVSVVSIFTGAVSAWQAAYQMEGLMGGLVSMNYLGSGVSAAIFIELSPVLVAIVIAGRVGASIAAELGTMRVTEQIDALEALAIDPIRYLAVPRFIAGWTMLPMLVVYSYWVAHLGAYVVAHFLLDVSTSTFFGSVQRNFSIYNLFSGLVKSFVFGGGTALIGCSIGFSTIGGAEGVGKATIKAFVFSSAFILIGDYVLAMILF